MVDGNDCLDLLDSIVQRYLETLHDQYRILSLDVLREVWTSEWNLRLDENHAKFTALVVEAAER